MKYFAYGSNLCVARLEGRDANPTYPRVARLEGYELTFNKKSASRNQMSGKANIVPTTKDGSVVWGVVFDIDDGSLAGLRAAEGYFIGHYREEKVTVVIDSLPTSVTAYIALGEHLMNSLHPYDWYLEHIVNGASQFEFPESYIDQLRSVKTIEDENADRTITEREFWKN